MMGQEGCSEWAAVYLLVLLGWVFAPVYLKLKLTTIPEYLERRFDAKCRLWFVMLVMVTYVVTKIGASLFSGAVVLEVLLGWSVWTSTAIIVIATAIYTAVGGLTVIPSVTSSSVDLCCGTRQSCTQTQSRRACFWWEV